jgi:hypothetical protein
MSAETAYILTYDVILRNYHNKMQKMKEFHYSLSEVRERIAQLERQNKIDYKFKQNFKILEGAFKEISAQNI